MGWGSGSELMQSVIFKLKKRKIDSATRKMIYEVLIPSMEDLDWDTQSDCKGIDKVYDSTLKSLYPDWCEEDESE